jgi:hypothetical protein
MEFEAILWLIKHRLVAGQPEGVTSRVWNSILTHIFTLKDGYTTGLEPTFGEDAEDPFLAHLVLNVEHSEKKILIVESKAPGLEDRKSIWTDGVNQLEQYLATMRTTNRKFGAIAVGRLVQFFEMVGSNLIYFQDDGTQYHIDRQCQSVTNKLEYFRDNHL